MDTTIEREAQTTLAQLLERVAQGERITITEFGVPVAVLAPPGNPRKLTAREAIAAIDEIAERNRLDGLSLREMIEEGRD